MTLTKKQKQKLKNIFFFLLFIWAVSYASYYVGRNDMGLSDAKKQLWVVQEELEQSIDNTQKDTEEEKSNTSESDAPIKEFEDIQEWDLDLGVFPVGVDFGTPVSLWDKRFTYSDLKGLEIMAWEFEKQTVNCENLSDYLWASLNTWFYWNTCRNVVSDEDGVSFYVIRLDEDKSQYIYEKHYILYKKWLYGVYELESSIGVDEDNIAVDIQAQNGNLKEKNPENGGEDFKVLEIVDQLFKKITNS